MMRRVVETAYGKIPVAELPSGDYLSTKLEEVEADEPQASPLDEITGAEEVQVQSLQSGLDPVGRIKITKVRAPPVLRSCGSS